jgi:hypothetical protein
LFYGHSCRETLVRRRVMGARMATYPVSGTCGRVRTVGGCQSSQIRRALLWLRQRFSFFQYEKEAPRAWAVSGQSFLWYYLYRLLVVQCCLVCFLGRHAASGDGLGHFLRAGKWSRQEVVSSRITEAGKNRRVVFDGALTARGGGAHPSSLVVGPAILVGE